MQSEPTPLQPVHDAAKAELLLHPLRQLILLEARKTSTAAEIARRIGLPPQKVNYHVRTLVDAGFLKPAGEGRKRNLVEKRYRASAQSYFLSPKVLGPMSSTTITDGDRFSAAYLMLLSSRLQEEVAAWLGPDDAAGERVPTLSLEAELSFVSADQRAEFAEALQTAIADVVTNHSSPTHSNDGTPTDGSRFRLVLGCYPVPPVLPHQPDPTPSNEALRS